MDQKVLVELTDKLKNELIKSAKTEPAAKSLLVTIDDLFNDVYAGKITEEIEWNDVPGGWTFLEGDLYGKLDLETAYSEFKLYITGMNED